MIFALFFAFAVMLWAYLDLAQTFELAKERHNYIAENGCCPCPYSQEWDFSLNNHSKEFNALEIAGQSPKS